jgi:hypothetical protein
MTYAFEIILFIAEKVLTPSDLQYIGDGSFRVLANLVT